jgi:hypothetical protein
MFKGPLARRPTLGLLGATATCALVGLTMGCAPPTPLPGTSLGTYNVTGTLETNTCGSGLGAPNPWTFTTQMSEDGAVLYWEISGGTELYSTMSSATQVSITSVSTTNVDGADAGIQGPCDLQSTTALDLNLSAGSPPATFTGTITYTFEAAVGVSSATNCTDQLSASGGTYDTLPCTASYSLAGMHQ